MDRTNWQRGKKNINILMLSITYKGIAIPLFWRLLDKKGNSNTNERIVLMERFIAQFGKNNIIGLLATGNLLVQIGLNGLKKNVFILLYELKKIY